MPAPTPLLIDLIAAINGRTCLTVEGTAIDLSDLVHPDAQQTTSSRLRTNLLVDGLRALARAGLWEHALTTAERLGGIDDHLTEGRQLAALAHAFGDRHTEATDLINTSVLTQPWDETVAACLSVLCANIAGRPAHRPARTMTNCFLTIPQELNLVTTATKLGLTVLDLTVDTALDTTEIVRRLVQDATAPGGGHAAHERLRHAVSTQLTPAQHDQLTQASHHTMLNQGDLDRQRARLHTAVTTSTSILAQLSQRHLRRGAPAGPTEGTVTPSLESVLSNSVCPVGPGCRHLDRRPS